MPSSKRNQPVPGEFYLLMPDTTRRGRGHGVEIENEDALLTPPRLIIRPEEGGFPHLSQRPRLVLDPKLGGSTAGSRRGNEWLLVGIGAP